jgi:hypothetical protein
MESETSEIQDRELLITRRVWFHITGSVPKTLYSHPGTFFLIQSTCKDTEE